MRTTVLSGVGLLEMHLAFLGGEVWGEGEGVFLESFREVTNEASLFSFFFIYSLPFIL